MLDDFVRVDRWMTGLVEDEGRGGGAERGVCRGVGEGARLRVAG